MLLPEIEVDSNFSGFYVVMIQMNKVCLCSIRNGRNTCTTCKTGGRCPQMSTTSFILINFEVGKDMGLGVPPIFFFLPGKQPLL